MDLISGYAVQIKSSENTGVLKRTLAIYRSALSYLVRFYESVWDSIPVFTDSQKQFNYLEHLVHTTKKHKAACDFDEQYYKMPSYVRRAAIRDAIGCVKSYRSSLKNWTEGGKKGKKPVLTADRYACPTFYYGNMYKDKTTSRKVKDDYHAMIKLYDGHDWKWFTIRFLKTDIDYISKKMSGADVSAPTLQKVNGHFRLMFAFTEHPVLNDTPLYQRKACAVDLGINTDAVCSIVVAAGTVSARKFINLADEKDLLYRVLNRIKKLQRCYGSANGAVKQLWKYVSSLNDEIAKLVSINIVEFAKENGADVIVFEYLDMKGKKHGSKKQKVHMWKKNSIQEYVEHKAHRAGIRVSHICAWGTSKLAFDGSGEVIRGRKNLTGKELREILKLRAAHKALPKDGRKETYTNRETCTFQNGKEYNCDLGASYNIGARYFIREILKEIPEPEKETLFTKIPDAMKTTTRTLGTLWALSTYWCDAAADAA